MAEVEKTLQARGVPVHGVQNSAECWADPQLQHRATTSPCPTRSTSRASSRARACVLSRTPGVVRRTGPTLGEHNDLVLRELLGYDDERIADLVIAGALG